MDAVVRGDMDHRHLAVRLFETAQKHSTRVATRVRVGDGWVTRTFAEFAADARRIAAHLVDMGVKPGDRIGLFANNCPEWSVIDLASLAIRAVVVPIYATSTVDQVRHIMADSGARLLVVDAASEYSRVAESRDDLPDLERVISIKAVEGLQSYGGLLDAEPSAEAVAEVDARLAAASGDDLASLIYTSGTTGEPRGVMLRHGGFTHQIDALEVFFDIEPDDHSLCFLPLSHALERAWTYVVLSHGCMNTYVADAKTVAEQMVLAQPTLMVSVPRLYEKVFLTAHQKVASSPAKKKIFDWALRVGGQCQRAYRKGRTPSPYWRAQLPLADKLVLSSVREAMGGPKTVMACGGAPLRVEIEEFFSAVGMMLYTGYGLTEASPLVSFNAPTAFKLGTAGRCIEGGELAIGEGGEILYRGANVMEGYWNDPESTSDALDDEGWLHTGDVGYIDVDGFLVITDRIKDIIVTAYGKNVAPAPIEGTILSDPLFEQAVVLGDNRPYLTLLVSPSLPHLEELAQQLQVKWSDRADLFSNPQILDALRTRVANLTSRLAHHEQIRDIRMAIEEFTMDNGLLTPTLKVKRREVEKRFAALIEDMYAFVTRRGKESNEEGAKDEAPPRRART